MHMRVCLQFLITAVFLMKYGDGIDRVRSYSIRNSNSRINGVGGGVRDWENVLRSRIGFRRFKSKCVNCLSEVYDHNKLECLNGLI